MLSQSDDSYKNELVSLRKQCERKVLEEKKSSEARFICLFMQVHEYANVQEPEVEVWSTLPSKVCMAAYINYPYNHVTIIIHITMAAYINIYTSNMF